MPPVVVVAGTPALVFPPSISLLEITSVTHMTVAMVRLPMALAAMKMLLVASMEAKAESLVVTVAAVASTVVRKGTSFLLSKLLTAAFISDPRFFTSLSMLSSTVPLQPHFNIRLFPFANIINSHSKAECPQPQKPRPCYNCGQEG